MRSEAGSSLGFALQIWQPILSIRWVHVPYRVPASLVTMRSGAGLSHLLAIAYDYDVLGLGPDSPWDDWRCPGTLRPSVWMVLTSMTLLIPAFALVCAPPVLAVGLLGCTQRSPTNPFPFTRKGSTASVRCLSLATLSVHAHSTSELLRTLSMMAASKPTSWLSLRTHSL